MTDLAIVASAKKVETTNEAQALTDILRWSKNRPKWQRDALRRLCEKDELDETDLEELTALCKKGGKGAILLVSDHIPDPKAATIEVGLRALHSVENVNALKPGERLTFDKTGLTVVYGDNGSGKSGYARVLKQVCRARSPKDDKILPNIYATKKGPQTSVIDFRANGQNKTANWMKGVPSDSLLSSVSVFDCRTANVHVDKVNDVAYTPFPMKLLERLADVCREIKDRLSAEIRELNRQTPKTINEPKCHTNTMVGKLIAELSWKTKEEDIQALVGLNADEKAKFEMLKTDLGSDPARVARQVAAQKKRLDGIDDRFSKLTDAIRDTRAHRLGELYQAYQTARAAAAVAASDLFANDPLPFVGSDVWRVLWEAARAYSEQNAYLNLPFPVTQDGARCVLCQQELDVEAADRLQRFEKFVKDETKRKEEEAKAAYTTTLAELKRADLAIGDIRDAVVLVRDELSDGMLASRMRKSAVTAKWRLRALLRNHVKVDAAEPLPVSEAWPSGTISVKSTELQERIDALEAEDESEERKAMRKLFQELTDREWLAVVEREVDPNPWTGWQLN